jgi:hypothetical protein
MQLPNEPIVFGPTFASELEAAGLGGLPFSWNINSGEFFGRENLTDEQNVTLDDVVAAHDPTDHLPPSPTPETTTLYDHENRLRSIEGLPPLSLTDFIARVAA